MVDLVLEHPRLEILGLDSHPSASTAIAVARRTLAVSSGMLRQPSRPTSEPSAATIPGLTRTSSPCA